MKSKIFITNILVLFFSTLIFSQATKSIKEKLDKINDNVAKIVITTDEGDVVFEGDEANTLLKRMKSNKIEKTITWISDDGENVSIDDGNVFVFKTDDNKHITKCFGSGKKNMIFISSDDSDIDGEKIIKIDIEIDSTDEGESKKVTVITKDDKEEKVEVYEGKEADEYLEKHGHKDDLAIVLELDSDSGDEDIEKRIEVNVDDGNKKVTVTTIKNGKETIKTYEGDEAEKFLEGMENDEHEVKVEEKILNGKKFKKIIIREIEDEDEK